VQVIVQLIISIFDVKLHWNCLGAMADYNHQRAIAEGKIGLGVQKKNRALFFRVGVTANALNDRQISITTYKMIDRRYTSAHFKDTSEKQPRR
jgi:hypothetical protein